MGWLAAGCCTVIAGILLYRFLVHNHAGEFRPAEVQAHTEHLNKFQLQTDDTQPAQGVDREELPDDRPTTKAPPPRLDLSQADGAADIAMADKVPRTVEQTPQTLMPPPRLPAPKLNRPASPPRLKPPSFGSAPAPPRPGNGFVRPPPSAASSLRVPITKPLPNASLAPTSSIMPPGKQVSRKVILEPGHSPLDWAALANNPNSNLRGKDAPGGSLIRVTPSQLKAQNGRKGRDVWTVYQGKVYNITPYVPFHPGGAGEILRGAGKDSVKLFMEVHPWVNWDGMLSECLVGILVGEDEGADRSAGALDEMD